MQALYDWVIVERYIPQAGITLEMPDETKFMEALAVTMRVVSAGKIFGPEGWEELPVSAGDVVLASLVGGIRIRSREGETRFAIRYSYLIAKLEEVASTHED